MSFAHEKLNVYKTSLDFARFVVARYSRMDGMHRNLRDQVMRASQSVVLNIAEGNGKWSKADRASFFQMARGSALECAAAVDLLEITGGLTADEVQEAKATLGNTVGMLSGLIESQRTQAREQIEEYGIRSRDDGEDLDRVRDKDKDRDKDRDKEQD